MKSRKSIIIGRIGVPGYKTVVDGTGLVKLIPDPAYETADDAVLVADLPRLIKRRGRKPRKHIHDVPFYVMPAYTGDRVYR